MRIGIILVLVVLASIVLGNVSFDGMTFGNTAFAVTQKTVCVYEPMDLFMDHSLTGIISGQAQTHKVAVKTISIASQLSGKTSGCDVVMKIDRAINENYRYTDKTTKYLIHGNTVTIFTYKTSAVFSPSSGGGSLGAASGTGSDNGGHTFTPMTNWSCEVLAHSSKYHSNYQITGSGPSSSGYCDPFAGKTYSPRNGELPYNVIKGSVDSALKVLGI